MFLLADQCFWDFKHPLTNNANLATVKTTKGRLECQVLQQNVLSQNNILYRYN